LTAKRTGPPRSRYLDLARADDFRFAVGVGFARARAFIAGLEADGMAISAIADCRGTMIGVVVSSTIFWGHLCADRIRRIVLSIGGAWLDIDSGFCQYQSATRSSASRTPPTNVKYRVRGTERSFALGRIAWRQSPNDRSVPKEALRPTMQCGPPACMGPWLCGLLLCHLRAWPTIALRGRAQFRPPATLVALLLSNTICRRVHF